MMLVTLILILLVLTLVSLLIKCQLRYRVQHLKAETEKQIMKKQNYMRAKQFSMVIVACVFISTCAPKQEQSTKSSLHTSSLVKKEVKPGAPVNLDYPTLISINPNQATNINLALKTPAILGKMHVDIIPGDGLQLLNTRAAYDLTLDGSTSYPLTAELLAPSDGRFYLNLHVTLDDGETVSSRALAVIVQVGPSAAESEQPSKLLKTSSGENVISLPAEETVTNK